MLSRVSFPWQAALTFHVPAVCAALMVIVSGSFRVAPLYDPVRTPFHVPVRELCVTRCVAAELAVAVIPTSTTAITRTRRIETIIADTQACDNP